MFNRQRRCLIIAALLASQLFVAAPSAAEMSKSEAAARAKTLHGGKVLSVEKVQSENGKTVFRIKLLQKGGRVKMVTVRG